MIDRYSALERRIARQLSHFPLLKHWIKNVYERAVYHLSGGYAASMEIQAPLREIGPVGADTFFGYYDKSPLSSEGWLLCHTASGPSHQPPQAKDAIAVQVFDARSSSLRTPVLSLETASYNWQQGARAHWLDGQHFIFNDFDTQGQRYISRVVSVTARHEICRYAHPVQDSWQREYFLSLNYRRLQSLRPEYGYRNLPPLNTQELKRLDDDGIHRIEQESGATCLLYSLQDICQVESEGCFRDARHKVNHIMIAPNGRQFIFLHRYFLGRRKYDRLMLAEADGSGLKVLCAHGMVSHCFWVNDDTLLCYLRGPDGHDGYHLIKTGTRTIQRLFDGALDSMGDGHPHVHGDFFITDSYPDQHRMQHLIKADLRSGTLTELGSFHHGFRYARGNRCDLHPRLSPDGRQAFIDSVCSGRRRLYCLELETCKEALP